MPGYGIPEARKGLLPWRWAEQRLKKSHNYWICTVKPDGAPHTMIVWGLWLDGIFCFSTGRQSRKARNLAENPRCIICTERADEAVIVEGKVQEVRERAHIVSFIQKYERKYNWDMAPYEEALYQHKDPLYSVHPRTVFALFEKKFMSAATRWKFEGA
jgi:hypothetical protein